MYFLDTCALLGYLKGEKAFEKTVESGNIILTRFHLMELYYIALKEQGEEMAERYYEAFSRYEEQLGEGTLKEGMKRRLSMQKRGLNVSYVDALGYQYAQEKGLLFVTSDPAFKALPGVEFIEAGKRR
jgi:predicted nucleic acid-binding protein